MFCVSVGVVGAWPIVTCTGVVCQYHSLTINSRSQEGETEERLRTGHSVNPFAAIRRHWRPPLFLPDSAIRRQ